MESWENLGQSDKEVGKMDERDFGVEIGEIQLSCQVNSLMENTPGKQQQQTSGYRIKTLEEDGNCRGGVET